MTQPDWTKSGMGGGNPEDRRFYDADTLIGWYSLNTGNVYRFALDRTVDHPEAVSWGPGTGYNSRAFTCQGVWYGLITKISLLRQNVGPSVHSRIYSPTVTITITRDETLPIIQNLLADIESTDGFSDTVHYVPIMINERDGTISPDDDTIFVGRIEPRSCKIFKDRIEITLTDPAKRILEKNILEEYNDTDYPDMEKNWIDRPIPRMYGEWGDLGAGSHNQYGFEVALINAADVHDDDATGWNWPIFRICNPGVIDFLLDQSTGIPYMANNYPKIWAFWGDDTAYDIWEIRECADQVTYPLSEGYVQGVRSIREWLGDYAVWGDGAGETIIDITAAAGNPLLVHIADWTPPPGVNTFAVGDRVLIQEVVGMTELNEEWWYINSVTKEPGVPHNDYELYYKDGVTPTNVDDFTAFVPTDGVLSTYVPIYKPDEPAGSRNTETEPFLVWVQDGDNSTFSVESQQNPGNPMTNPVEIAYDLLVNCGGESSLNFATDFWASYALFETNSIKARRWIKDQMTVKEALEELQHEFGMMIFMHAGVWHCYQNRIWPHDVSYLDLHVYPKDIKKGTYKETEDPAKEGMPADWGVKLFYLWDQADQVFTPQKLSSIDQQFSATQAPTQSVSSLAVPYLNDSQHYAYYTYPITAFNLAKAYIIESKWIYDAVTASTMAELFSKAMNVNQTNSPGNRGVSAKVIKRTMDPGYHLGDILRFWNSTIEPTESVTGQIYERAIDFEKKTVEERCYEVRITGE
jgi:hypothetical protein